MQKLFDNWSEKIINIKQNDKQKITGRRATIDQTTCEDNLRKKVRKMLQRKSFIIIHSKINNS